MIVDVYLGLKIPANFPLSMREKLLVAMVEVGIGPSPATLTNTTQMVMVDCCVYLVLLTIWMIVLMKIK